jgi:hypothetical protein
LLDYSDEPNNVLLVSDRTLYILNNLSLVDVHNLNRYYLERYQNGYAAFVDEFDAETLQSRTVVKERPDGVALPNDVPNHEGPLPERS